MCKILVLDNCSGNGSVELLKQHYKNIPIIEVIENDTNEGFSAGNNRLFLLAKEFSPNYIVMLNNDVAIWQKDFIKVLMNINLTKKDYIIGPDVRNAYEHTHQSPLYYSIPPLSDIEKWVPYWDSIIRNPVLFRKRDLLNKFRIMIHRLLPVSIVSFIRIIKRNMGLRTANTIDKGKLVYNAVLQGSCIIFTGNYLDCEDVAFEPDTGFYFEELLLALKCKTKGYRTVFAPKLEVNHYHSTASKLSAKNYANFMYSYAIRIKKAYEIYREAFLNNPWEK